MGFLDSSNSVCSPWQKLRESLPHRTDLLWPAPLPWPLGSCFPRGTGPSLTCVALHKQMQPISSSPHNPALRCSPTGVQHWAPNLSFRHHSRRALQGYPRHRETGRQKAYMPAQCKDQIYGPCIPAERLPLTPADSLTRAPLRRNLLVGSHGCKLPQYRSAKSFITWKKKPTRNTYSLLLDAAVRITECRNISVMAAL